MLKRLLTIGLFLGSIFSCTPKNTPEYAAKQYLTALKNKDWETAKKYSTETTHAPLDMYKSLDFDFGITEIKDIKCVVKENVAKCTFCCSTDTGFKHIFLTLNDKNKWETDQSKESYFKYRYWE